MPNVDITTDLLSFNVENSRLDAIIQPVTPLWNRHPRINLGKNHIFIRALHADFILS